MKPYVILLRGVNVGGRTVKSAELKNCFIKAGFKNVQTVIATGNVIIESNDSAAKLKPEVENILENYFNFPIKVCLVDEKQLYKIIKNYPFENSAEFHRYAVLVEPGMEKELASLGKDLNEKVEAVQPGNMVVYWRVVKGNTLHSTFGESMSKYASKHFSTNRNVNTLEKIAAKMRELK